jgi:hypothetical protein
MVASRLRWPLTEWVASQEKGPFGLATGDAGTLDGLLITPAVTLPADAVVRGHLGGMTPPAREASAGGGASSAHAARSCRGAAVS